MCAEAAEDAAPSDGTVDSAEAAGAEESAGPKWTEEELAMWNETEAGRLANEERPDEDDLVLNNHYQEMLVWYAREQSLLPKGHVDRMQKPESLVLVLRKFSSMRCSCPALFDHVEPRLQAAAEDGSLPDWALPDAAVAYAAQQSGSEGLWQAFAARGEKAAGLSDRASARLAAALRVGPSKEGFPAEQ